MYSATTSEVLDFRSHIFGIEQLALVSSGRLKKPFSAFGSFLQKSFQAFVVGTLLDSLILQRLTGDSY